MTLRLISKQFIIAKREPDVVTLAAQPNPATVGKTVAFVVTVTASSAPAPTGTVGLYNVTTQKTVQEKTLTNGTVSFAIPASSTGATSFSAAYAGDNNYLGKFSPIVTLTVN
jgi:hypothetical protein